MKDVVIGAATINLENVAFFRREDTQPYGSYNSLYISFNSRTRFRICY